ncbi:hypothetical protein [Conexibacter woesei]|uniref:hypothetical protein n=1 Tax=Conexibacter woesei TaxID=191495 RepID=UPI000552A8E9|nr:hypothetical protein [Conexibacter woesei]
MRKILQVLLILVAVFACGASTAAAKTAPVRKLHAGQVGGRGTQLMAQADPTTVAYRTGPRFDAPTVLRTDDRVVRTVTSPEGCVLSAAGSGLLAGECGERGANGVMHLVVTRLDGTVVTQLDARSDDDAANGYTAGSPVYVGAQWIRGYNSAKEAGHWWQDVNWHTGEVRESGEEDAGQVDDLDAAGLYDALCAPLRRVWRGEPDMAALPEYYAAQVDGPWALIQAPAPPSPTDATNEPTAFTLRRCGLARPVALPVHFRPTALGEGWVAGLTTIAHHGTRFDVIRLADRRRYNMAGVGPGSYEVVFTRGRIYVSSSTGLWTTRLPQK